MDKWNIAFLGTFHPAVPTLRALLERSWVRVVVLPELAGNKNEDLIALCKKHGTPYTYTLADVENHDVNLILAANYPTVVPASYLKKYPCVNTHWSALPNYRGVHGTAWALLNADYDVGCSIHWMGEDFDVGDLITQVYVRMEPDMNILDLHRELAQKQAEAVVHLLERYGSPEEWPRTAQEHERATYVPQRHPEDGLIDWAWPTERIWNLVRALPSPLYPGAFTYLDGRRLVIWKARPVECPEYFSTPGQVVRVVKGNSVWIKTGDTCLEVENVQFEGAAEPARADTVLKRGAKLGFSASLAFEEISRRLARIEARLGLTGGTETP
jgi:methionyl-tRNA formyltransferase